MNLNQGVTLTIIMYQQAQRRMDNSLMNLGNKRIMTTYESSPKGLAQVVVTLVINAFQGMGFNTPKDNDRLGATHT